MGDNDEMIERIAAELRASVHLDATFDDKVMRAVRSASPAGARPSMVAARGGAWGWLTRPRSVSISPLGAFAFAAALLAMVVAGADLRGRGVPAPGASVAVTPTADAAQTPSDVSPASSAKATVQFVVRVPNAMQVTLAGDFNQWDIAATPLQHAAGDLWTVTLPLTPGRYTYSFVINGTRWVADPTAPRARGDDFGQPSSVVMVAGSSL